MAWQSSGATNQELCDRLRDYGVIQSTRVLQAFRAVDRSLFVPEPVRAEAFKDQPLKIGNVHLSAPHIYGTAMDALELEEGVSFLNVGAGTGYISCVAAMIGGPTSVNHGIELHEDVHAFSLLCVKRFNESLGAKAHHNGGEPEEGGPAKAEAEQALPAPPAAALAGAAAPPPPLLASSSALSAGGGDGGEDTWRRRTSSSGKDSARMARVELCHGNVFDVDPAQSIRYDRIYIGAQCPPDKRAFLSSLLSCGGILVGPVGDELLKIRRVGEDEYTMVCLAGVRFAPLIVGERADKPVQLPRRIWCPDDHETYPLSFRRSVRTVLLSAQRDGCILSCLPHNLWLEILAFTDRGWFVPEPTEVEMLLRRLEAEMAARREAEDMARKATRMRRDAERERDMYKMLVRRLHLQLQYVMPPHHDEDEHPDEHDQQERDPEPEPEPEPTPDAPPEHPSGDMEDTESLQSCLAEEADEEEEEEMADALAEEEEQEEDGA